MFNIVRSLCLGLSLLCTVACGDDDPSEAARTGSNRARFLFNCDLQGANGVLTMDVEAIRTTGLTWGPGVNPDITGVIATGGFTYLTEGELRSSVALYRFTGENQFADFWDTASFERFRVQWVANNDDLVMVINPFGPGPTQHFCTLESAELI